MGDAWGKVYAFNATLQNVEGFFNDPQANRFVALRGRSSPPYMAQAVPIERGDPAPGVISDQTSAKFQDAANSWWATYEISIPGADAAAAPNPISHEDDLVLYVFRTCLALFDTNGFNVAFIPPIATGGTQ